jgi:hypothetical protein
MRYTERDEVRLVYCIDVNDYRPEKSTAQGEVVKVFGSRRGADNFIWKQKKKDARAGKRNVYLIVQWEVER